MITNGEELSKKINNMKDNVLDLASGEDLSIGIMNLISLEEHFFFSYGKTKDQKFLDMLNDVRKMRAELLKEIVKDPTGEVWCISKHLLAASMRIMEVATKKLKSNETTLAKDLFDKSYNLYSLFWALNLKIIDVKDVKSGIPEADVSVPIGESKEKIINHPSASIFSKIGNIVKNLVDCCKE